MPDDLNPYDTGAPATPTERQRRAGELAQQRLTRAWWADTLRWHGRALPAEMLARLTHCIDTEHHPTE